MWLQSCSCSSRRHVRLCSSPEGRRRWPTLLRSAARISRTFSPSLPSFLFPELRRKGGGGGVTFFPPQASHQLETDEGTAFCACTTVFFSPLSSPPRLPSSNYDCRKCFKIWHTSLGSTPCQMNQRSRQRTKALKSSFDMK